MGWGKLHEMNEAELVLTSGSLLLTAEFSQHIDPKTKKCESLKYLHLRKCLIEESSIYVGAENKCHM